MVRCPWSHEHHQSYANTSHPGLQISFTISNNNVLSVDATDLDSGRHYTWQTTGGALIANGVNAAMLRDGVLPYSTLSATQVAARCCLHTLHACTCHSMLSCSTRPPPPRTTVWLSSSMQPSQHCALQPAPTLDPSTLRR